MKQSSWKSETGLTIMELLDLFTIAECEEARCPVSFVTDALYDMSRDYIVPAAYIIPAVESLLFEYLPAEDRASVNVDLAVEQLRFVMEDDPFLMLSGDGHDASDAVERLLEEAEDALVLCRRAENEVLMHLTRELDVAYGVRRSLRRRSAV